MNISEFFNQIITLAESGNWSGIWTLILGVFATFLGSAAGITIITALIKILFGNKKLLAKIGVKVGDFFADIKIFFQSLFERNKNEISNYVEEQVTNLNNTISQLNNKIATIENSLTNNELLLQAFIDTVLNTESLQLTNSNRLRELQLLHNSNEIIENVEDTNETEITEDIPPVVEEIVREEDTKKKKKLKFKKEE